MLFVFSLSKLPRATLLHQPPTQRCCHGQIEEPHTHYTQASSRLPTYTAMKVEVVSSGKAAKGTITVGLSTPQEKGKKTKRFQFQAISYRHLSLSCSRRCFSLAKRPRWRLRLHHYNASIFPQCTSLWCHGIDWWVLEMCRSWPCVRSEKHRLSTRMGHSHGNPRRHNAASAAR